MKKIYLLTTGLCFSIALMAQSPGGVDAADLVMWLRADASSTIGTAGSNVNSWTYFNNPSNSFTYTVGNQAVLLTNALNFLPVLGFDSTQMDGPTGTSAPLSGTGGPSSVAYAIFAVWNSSVSGTSSGPFQRAWCQFGGSSDVTYGSGTALWLDDALWGEQMEIGPSYTTGIGNPYSTGTYYLTEENLLNQGSNDLQLIDQTNIATGPMILSTNGTTGNTTRAALSNAVNRLGMKDNSNSTDREPFYGNLAELFIYQVPVDNTTPSSNARNQIFSYLSMKYGIPVGISILSSAGMTEWDNTRGNAGFNNDVFGLAVDNGSNLNVQSSQASTTAGVSGAGNIVLTPFGTLSADQSFLLVGHDTHPLNEETTGMPAYASGSERLTRNWFTQNAGSGGAVGLVNLGIDLTGVPISGSLSTPTDFRLMVNYSGDTTFASTDGLYTSSGILGNVVNFSGVNLPDGSVFAVISNASAGTPLPVTFISFTAQPSDGNVDLNWVVGDNQEASSYEVDRSSDGVNFTKVAELPNEADETSYSFVDANPGAGTHYYRVLETDENGKSIYSKVVSATIGAGDFSVAVLNNPAVGRTDAQLQINAVNSGVAFIELWTIDGKRMSLQQESIGAGTTTISVPMSNLARGSYVVKVIVNNNTHVAQVVKM